MRWVIGDIHGMLRPLEALVRVIERHDDKRQLMFVGDYVNRGPDSRGVIDFLLTLKDAHFVRGNHDDVFDHVLSSQSYCGEAGEDYRRTSFQWFMQHGLDRTFMSYGVTENDLLRAAQRPTQANLDLVAGAVPEAHRNWIRALPVVLETEDMFVTHAKWDVFTPSDPAVMQQRLASAAARQTLVWGRYSADEIEIEKPWLRTGYFGHTPVDNYYPTSERDDDLLPVIGPKIVLLDTAVALLPHGRLTAFCHESSSFLQVDPAGKPIVPK